jgi:CHAT domain-containing protein/tetratricopeptide (TPR) repeat protein
MPLPKLTSTVFMAAIASLTLSDLPIFFNFSSHRQNSQVLAATTNSNQSEAADELFKQGLEKFENRQFDQAIELWQRALRIYQQVQNSSRERITLTNLGAAYFHLNDYPKAIDYAKQGLAIARAIKDRQGEANALGIIGNTYMAWEKYPQAIDYFQQQLAIAKELQVREVEGKVVSNLAFGYRALKNYPKAIEYHQQELAIARELHNREQEGEVLGNLGFTYQLFEDYSQAVQYYQQSLVIYRELKNRLYEGVALGNLGDSFYHLGDYTQAILYQQQSLAIALEIKDREGESNSLDNLGLNYRAVGNFSRAITYHQQSLAIAREIKDRQGELDSLNSLGNAYSSQSEYAKAINYYQQSLAIAKEIKNRTGEANALGNLGLSYYHLGDYAQAITLQEQSLAIAREIKDRQSEGITLRILGMVYRALGDYNQAIAYQQQSLAIARELKDLHSQGESLNNLGNALRLSGNLPAAETTLIDGIKVWESIRAKLGNNDANKVSIFDTQAGTYRLLQSVLIAQNKTDAALEVAESGRARSFVELLSRRLSAQSTQVAKITPPNLEDIKRIAKTENATLVQYTINYDDFKVAGKESSQEAELYIWVIKPTGEITFHRTDLKPLWQQEKTSLKDLVATSRESIGARGRGGIEVVALVDQPNQLKRLQKLHQLLIAPIADDLPSDPNARVIFIPQSSLFLVPFPALQNPDGKYLIEQHTILTAPSIQVLELTHKQRRNLSGTTALVVGNPTMPSIPPQIGEMPQPLPQLPGAEKEALAIAQLLNTKATIGDRATKKAILQQISTAKIIHLATHGLLDDFKGVGIPGAIALAPDSTLPKNTDMSNSLLTSAEILDLKLNAELVVLSACDTGRGTITGDGVIGLSRAFITAGVPSILVSLWSVPDAPTAALMTAFYRQMAQQPDKAQALRQAMLTTMKQHPNPKDWAAFTLIGEAE